MDAESNRELERLRAEVAGLRRKVEELGASSDKFLAVATHDLRSPLASLRLIADMLAEPGKVAPGAAPLVDTMGRNLDTMEALVADVLDASRLSHPGGPLKFEEFALNGLLEDALAGSFPVAIRKQVALDARLSPAAGTVLADRRRVGQVVSNFLSNALKFTPPGGTVVVASDGGDDDWVEVSVSDTGPGLSADDRQSVFSPFFRGSAPPTGGEPCTGLGLYITRQIAESHGGSVGAEGAPGKGSLFFLRIPRRAKQPGGQQ